MERVLIVSPFPRNKNLYPHLAEFLDKFNESFEIEYFYIHERGYWIDEEFARVLKKPFNIFNYSFIIKLIFDCLRLFGYRFKKYSFVIAIDNFPYVISNILLNFRIILWSHDFVSHGQTKWDNRVQQYIINKSRKYLAEQNELIIQDEDRLNLFLESIKAVGLKFKVYFLPVSLMPLKSMKVNNNIIPVLMQIGGISEIRSGSNELIEYFQTHTDIFQLFLHGYFSPETTQLLSEIKTKPKISSVPLSYKDISSLVSKCDIGFICYKPTDLNFFHISFASGQIAEFLRCGKPIISFNNTSIGSHIDNLKIGKSINKTDDLENAVKVIVKNYDEYVNNCIRAYNKYYNLETHTASLIEKLVN